MTKNLQTVFTIQAYALRQVGNDFVIPPRVGTKATKIDLEQVDEYFSQAASREGSSKKIPCTIVKLDGTYYGIPKENYNSADNPIAAEFIQTVFGLGPP